MGIWQIGLAAVLAAPMPATPAAIPATDVALAWLAMIDRGSFQQSWAAAGALFQSRVGQRAWVDMIGAVRRPLGDVALRRPVGEETAHTLAGAPDGRYVVLRFATRFTTKREGVETVTLVDETGGWKVVGYFVR